MQSVLAPEDREQIHNLKARYFRLIDTKRWEEWGDVFTHDAVLDVPEMRFLVQGRDAIVAAVREALDEVVTVHHGHMGELERVDETHARGIWAMEDHVIWTPLSGDRSASHTMHGYGHYLEHYRRDDGTWRIERSHLSRLHVETVKVRHHRNVTLNERGW
jgi:hypothetical protein